MATPGTSSAPTLAEPTGETIVAGSTIGIGGSYVDSFAATTPGDMLLQVSDSQGFLFARDAEGNQVSGYGSRAVTLHGSYLDVQSALRSLTYSAAGTPGSDTINLDVWNQAGQETTASVPVQITPATMGGSVEQWTGAVSGDWNNAGNWSGGAVPVSGDTVVISGNVTNNPTLANATLSGETITLEGNGNSAPMVTFDNVMLDSLLQSGNAGHVEIGGTLTIGVQGTLLAEQNASFSLSGTAPAVVNNGLIESGAGGALDFTIDAYSTSNATLVNNGSILAQGGEVRLGNWQYLPGTTPDWSVQNTGSVTISQDGGLRVDGTIAGGTIALAGPGTLSLERVQALNEVAVSGFGQGDEIALYGAQGSIAAVQNGTLEIGAGGSVESIALGGSVGLGNLEVSSVTGPGQAEVIAYAPSGGSSDQLGQNIVAPASDTVSQGGTVSLGDVSLQPANSGTIQNSATISIDAGSGTLYLAGASGSGTSHISLGPVTFAQANAELAKLSYVPAAGVTSDTVKVDVLGQAPTDLQRSIAIAVTGSSSASGLQEPSSRTVTASGQVAVSGSYTDAAAAGNPGAMYLHISDSSGTLSATDAAGNAVAGSGTNSITLTTDYADVNAVLHSLAYTAGSAAGSDTISFDLWNQLGQETTGSVAVTVGAGSSGGMSSTPSLTEPASETVTAGATQAVTGRYTDSFAEATPGRLYLSIQDSSGTLSATDASGAAVAGSGSSSIGLSTDYADVNAILANLHYTAGGSAGTDTIQFAVWNQAGQETTGSTAVSVQAPAPTLAGSLAAPASLMDFPMPAGSGSATLMPATTAMSAASLAATDPGNHAVLAAKPLPHA